MSDKSIHISNPVSGWKTSVPVLRYAFGATFLIAVSSLWSYDLSYLTPVLALGYIAPGTKPLTFKQVSSFLLILFVISVITVLVSGILLDYPLVFVPVLLLALLWTYYGLDKSMIIKVFVLISILVIPFVSIDSTAIGSYIAINLFLNAFMAIILTQFVFLLFPWSGADEIYVKLQPSVPDRTDKERFISALNILIVIIPVIILFYTFKLTSSLLSMIFIGILSISPALANPKVGLVLIIANIFGGLIAIFAFQLLTIAPSYIFMLLLVLTAGLIIGIRVFSDNKFAPVFKSGFSTFLLILGSVTASDAEAANEVWTRVFQISLAVIYVVIAFRLLKLFDHSKIKEST
jgi:hypothetical protein